MCGMLLFRSQWEKALPCKDMRRVNQRYVEIVMSTDNSSQRTPRPSVTETVSERLSPAVIWRVPRGRVGILTLRHPLEPTPTQNQQTETP